LQKLIKRIDKGIAMKRIILILLAVLIIPTGCGYYGESGVPAGPNPLYEQGSDPSTLDSIGWIYTKDDSGDTELFYKDDSGNIVQVTEDGALNTLWVDDSANLHPKAARNIIPYSSDGGALGSAAYMFSDLFLANGGVINFNNGTTITHSSAGFNFNSPILITSGSVTQAAYAFSDDSTSGLYRIGASRLGITLGGVKKVDFKADGTDILNTNGQLKISDREDDSHNKIGRYVMNHYDMDEEPFGMFVSQSTSTANTINYGGGSSIANAATQIVWYTAANNTTTTGTARMAVDGNNGIYFGLNSTKLGVGYAIGEALTKEFNVKGDALITGTLTKGGLITKSSSESVEDDAYIDLPDATSGWGTVFVGDNEEFATFRWTTAGVVTLMTNTANVIASDTGA